MRRESRDRVFDLSFMLVEAFAALEVTAVIVANVGITDALGLPEHLSSWVLGAYLIPLFATMLLCLATASRIARVIYPRTLFLAGLAAFALGNAGCAIATGPRAFFASRVVMGVGAAIAFTGELWTASEFQSHRIAAPLVLGEIGAALGVVAGPLVGGALMGLGRYGWRGLFVLNGSLALLTMLGARISLPHAPARAIESANSSAPDRSSIARKMTALQVLVSMLTVGAEYLFSDYLQAKLGKSAMFVGVMTFFASIGVIAGSVLAGRRTERVEALPDVALGGIVVATAALAGCLAERWLFAAAAPIVVAGFFMGMANVSIYAVIVQSSAPDAFLRRSLVYLVAMQIGNAAGVQTIGATEAWHWGVVSTTAAVIGAALAALGAFRLVEWGRTRRELARSRAAATYTPRG